MSEWWTYRLSSFLLFSPATYHRLFVLYNAAIWPAQVAAVGIGAAIPLVLRRATGGRGRAIAFLLAASWLFIGAAFLAARYATINWAATHFAWGFGLEGALLIAMAVGRGDLVFERPADFTGRVGLGLFLFALCVEPLVGPLLGRSWSSIELFGVAPDPTAVATLGLLLLARGRGRGLLMVVPVLWCLTTGAFLEAMQERDAWIPPLAGMLAVALAVRQSWMRRRR
jgi:hypothetical protein